MKKKSGFTLAEVLITLAIIGVVAALVAPVIKNAQPNKEMTMVKKAYYNTSRLVSELINDEDLYPERETREASGFSNVEISDQLGEEALFQGEHYSGNTKFCGLFGAKINTLSEPSCGEERGKLSAGGNFITPDGIVWSMPISRWGSEYEDIYVDVNGTEKGPNCTKDADMSDGTPTCPKGVGPDRFLFRVYRHGRIDLPGQVSSVYVSSTHVNYPYKEFVRQGLISD